MLKKLWKFLSSMRFAILLLLILCAACAVGSVVPQGKELAWYAAAYSERSAAVIKALWLDDVYHSPWFLAIAGFLCCNLLLCNLLRLPGVVRGARAFADPTGTPPDPDAAVEGIEDARAVFSALRMPEPVRIGREESETLFSAKNSAGFWGAWVCHLGILLLILGFGLGQMTHEEHAVYGVPGQTRQIGESSLLLTIDDFRVDLREDDTVEQYTARVTVRDTESGEDKEATISVNHPARLFGYQFYQNSTGWAARASVLKNGAPLQEETLCAGEYLRVKDKPDLAVHFRAFYPDYVHKPGQEPRTASGALRNPAYLYAIYYRDEIVGMNVLTGDETIRIDEYEIRFGEPQNYTVIQIKRDRFTALALLGGIVTALGLFLALYVLPCRLWAIRRQDGTWTVSGSARKGGALFAERLREAARKKKEGS